MANLSGTQTRCRFELVLRAIKAESATEVAAAVDALRLSGFINYYGLQRFGTGAVPTHRYFKLQRQWAGRRLSSMYWNQQ